MINHIKKKFDVLRVAKDNQGLRKEIKTLTAENEILKSALRMHEGSGKKNAAFRQRSLRS
jgi:hypothetical protein